MVSEVVQLAHTLLEVFRLFRFLKNTAVNDFVLFQLISFARFCSGKPPPGAPEIRENWYWLAAPW